MVDIWLLFCIAIIFWIIIFHAIIDHALSKEQSPYGHGQSNIFTKVISITPIGEPMNSKSELKDTSNTVPKSQKLIFASKIIILSIFLLFNLIYWGIILF